MDKQLFLDWYLGGSDQEREYTILSIGHYIVNQLKENDSASISIDTLIEGSDVDLFYQDLKIEES